MNLPISIGTDHPLAHTDAFCDWLREHEVAPEDTFKVAVDGDWMVVFQYARNSAGSKFVDKMTGEVVTVAPYHIKIQRPLRPDD
jgi:hypothetical protein